MKNRHSFSFGKSCKCSHSNPEGKEDCTLKWRVLTFQTWRWRQWVTVRCRYPHIRLQCHNLEGHKLCGNDGNMQWHLPMWRAPNTWALGAVLFTAGLLSNHIYLCLHQIVCSFLVNTSGMATFPHVLNNGYTDKITVCWDITPCSLVERY
jgi:hypothetical protein